MGISRFLSFGGRLILVNSVHSALPTFYLCSLKLPIEIIDQIDKCMKHVLWHGGDMTKKGGYLVAWKHAFCSKEDGGSGLGIIDLRTPNEALLLKYLHKFYNKLYLPWVHLTWQHFYSNGTPPQERKGVGSFWWRDDVMSLFQIASYSANFGSSMVFWGDLWDLGVLKWKYPQLFSFARNKRCSVKQFIEWDESMSFFLPLSQIACNQLTELKLAIDELHLDVTIEDTWSYIWGLPPFLAKEPIPLFKDPTLLHLFSNGSGNLGCT